MMQLSFGEEFEAAAFEQRTAHLPNELSAAIPYFRSLIYQHHEALLAGDLDAAERINGEAHDLAVKLNGGDPAILADDDSPGNVLERETAAPEGEVPKWGQTGSFVIAIAGARVRVEMEGIFGLAAAPLPGFVVMAMDYDKPFLSETGFKSFLGYQVALTPGALPDEHARTVIEAYIRERLRGRLYRIEARYHPSSEPGVTDVAAAPGS
jgi:hypothetical protein